MAESASETKKQNKSKAKVKKIEIDLKEAVLKNPKAVIQVLTSNIQNLKFTKVINTYVFESRILKVQLAREGRVFQQGDLVWIGNKKSNADGSVICFQADKNDLRQLIPSEDTCQELILDTNKEVIKISIMARYKCSVCGKSMEIFDEDLQCPICDAKAHAEHFKDWIRSKGSCPVCQKPLALNKQELPTPGDE